jgi:hypothetical protein
MQLIAGRTAQEYNQRKGRQGAFWEDRYHATAIEADEHLHRCLIYIDLNMVRAGVVSHPVEWVHSGYREIQEPPKRYAIIDLEGLAALCGFTDLRAWLSLRGSKTILASKPCIGKWYEQTELTHCTSRLKCMCVI